MLLSYFARTGGDIRLLRKLGRAIIKGYTVVAFSFIGLGCKRSRVSASGECPRLPPMCPEFHSRTAGHMWDEFAGSLPAPRGFSPGAPVFPLPPKPVFNLILFDLSSFV